MSYITLYYEKDTLPDLLNGETEEDSKKLVLEIKMTDAGMSSYNQFMDDLDKKDAIDCFRSVLSLFEKKEGLK